MGAHSWWVAGYMRKEMGRAGGGERVSVICSMDQGERQCFQDGLQDLNVGFKAQRSSLSCPHSHLPRGAPEASSGDVGNVIHWPPQKDGTKLLLLVDLGTNV